MIAGLGAHIATDLDAHIGARHIVETRPVEAANLHVFDRFGLDGKISCLPSANRNQTSRGAEEEAFHHLHIEPPIVAVGGFRVCRLGIHPSKAPLVPKTARSFPSPKTPDESTSGSPLRRTPTLSDGFRHATKNCPSHRGRQTISGMCCVKNTQPAIRLFTRKSVVRLG